MRDPGCPHGSTSCGDCRLTAFTRVRREDDLILENQGAALLATGGDMSKAAALLGVNRRTVYNRLHGLTRTKGKRGLAAA